MLSPLGGIEGDSPRTLKGGLRGTIVGSPWLFRFLSAEKGRTRPCPVLALLLSLTFALALFSLSFCATKGPKTWGLPQCPHTPQRPKGVSLVNPAFDMLIVVSPFPCQASRAQVPPPRLFLSAGKLTFPGASFTIKMDFVGEPCGVEKVKPDP